MKKIVAGILAAVIGVSVAASGAVKAGNRQETSAGWNNGICVNSSVCPNHHNNTGDCDNYQNKICNNAEGHHMHHQNSGCRGGRNR